MNIQTQGIQGEALSMKGRKWVTKPVDRSIMDGLTSAGLNASISQILAGRKIGVDDLQAFIEPSVKNLLPSPSFFKGMIDGAKHVSAQIREGNRIGIWSDYDVDGATSAAILGRFFRMCGHNDFVVRIPDRMTEGYGPNTPGLLSMKADQGCNTICILDAGTLAFEPLAEAKKADIDVVVIDHHAAEDTLPEGVAIVNPNRKDQDPGYGHLCAAGMTFIFAIAVATELKSSGYFEDREKPNLLHLLDLVALGTVCDVVALTGLNRAFVHTGIKLLTQRRNLGVAALAKAASLAEGSIISEKECGWVLGPRINAGGRIGDSTLGARLLLADDLQEAKEIADQLDEMNVERKALEASATNEAMAYLSSRKTGTDRTLALAVVDAHEGVVGISASRVKDAFDAPAIVLTPAHDDTIKGSARSVMDFDIGHAIIAAHQAGLIIKGGGHGMAGGLTLTREQLPDFITFMNGEIEKTEYARVGVSSMADISLPLDKVDTKMIDDVQKLKPFGTANLMPSYIIAGAYLAETRILKEKHLKLILRSDAGRGGSTIDCLLWNCIGTDLGDAILAAIDQKVDVMGQLEINEFRGNRTPQMMIEDIRLAH